MAKKLDPPRTGSLRPPFELVRASEVRAVVQVNPPAPVIRPDLSPPVGKAHEWDNCDDPARMLPILGHWSSLRKLRLMACAIVRYAPYSPDGRTVWELVPEYDWYELLFISASKMNCRGVVEEAEVRADGQLGDACWETVRECAKLAEWLAEVDTFGLDPERSDGAEFRYGAAGIIQHVAENELDSFARFMVSYAEYTSHEPGAIHPANMATVCRLIDDIHGNPFRPAIVRRDRVSDSALNLARTIYEDRAFELMPILGDALEETGTVDGEILRHCRAGGVHARGCWVLDQVLMKEWLPPFRPRKGGSEVKR